MDIHCDIFKCLMEIYKAYLEDGKNITGISIYLSK